MMNTEHMAELVAGMASDAIESFTKRDSKMARELFDRDDEVDCLYDTIFREILTYMIEDGRKISAGINYILVARYLERNSGRLLQHRRAGRLHGHRRTHGPGGAKKNLLQQCRPFQEGTRS